LAAARESDGNSAESADDLVEISDEEAERIIERFRLSGFRG